VIDDLFDHSFITKLEDTLLEDTPVYTTNVANSTSRPIGRKGSHRLFGVDIFVRKSINRVDILHEKAAAFFDAFEIIEETFNCPIYLERIDVNLQPFGADGTTHVDADPDTKDLTVMLMNNSEWKPEWGGQFQLMNGETVVEEHEYVPGRVLIFPGNHPHRGLAPSVPYVYRYTTVFRIIPQDD
tara:strand:- start:217 stop:768 length:552 start_codon:yes stop_codon:yes gene_type:complete